MSPSVVLPVAGAVLVATAALACITVYQQAMFGVTERAVHEFDRTFSPDLSLFREFMAARERGLVTIADSMAVLARSGLASTVPTVPQFEQVRSSYVCAHVYMCVNVARRRVCARCTRAQLIRATCNAAFRVPLQSACCSRSRNTSHAQRPQSSFLSDILRSAVFGSVQSR